jgi:hypothetical protein
VSLVKAKQHGVSSSCDGNCPKREFRYAWITLSMTIIEQVGVAAKLLRFIFGRTSVQITTGIQAILSMVFRGSVPSGEYG